MADTDDAARRLLADARAVAHRSSALPTERAGAIAVTRDGSRFPGIAVSIRTSPGLSVCAEQVAISAARAATTSPVRQIALWVPAGAADHPCGRCLQVWQELAPEAEFHLQRGDEPPVRLDRQALLPDAFHEFRGTP